MKIDKETQDENITYERREELYKYHNYILDFIYSAYSEGVIDGVVGDQLMKYQKKLVEKDKIAVVDFKEVNKE